MKRFLIMFATSVMLLSIIKSTHAVDCYECVYIQNTNGSEANCENNPDKLKAINCGSKTSLLNPLSTSGSLPPKMLQQQMLQDGKQATNKTLCMTAKGSTSGKKVVIRSCDRVPSSYEGKCVKDFDWVIRFPNASTIIIPGNTTNSLETCLCSKNKCNNGNGVQPVFTIAVLGLVVSMVQKFE